MSIFPSPRRCVGKSFYREDTAENGTRSARVLPTHGNQNAARGMPVELRSRVDGRHPPARTLR